MALLPDLIGKKRLLSKFINKLPPPLKKVLAWCSLCDYFTETVLKEILLDLQQEIEVSDELWHWIIDLEFTQKFPVADDFYQIKPSYRKLLQKYINQGENRSNLVRILKKCVRNGSKPQYVSLYKAEIIIHQIRSNSPDITQEAIDDILDIFRYEETVYKIFLGSLYEKF